MRTHRQTLQCKHLTLAQLHCSHVYAHGDTATSTHTCLQTYVPLGMRMHGWKYVAPCIVGCVSADVSVLAHLKATCNSSLADVFGA